MAPSKPTRIMVLLGVDSAFFLLELIVGTSVHSLALVADSFHMLNDVLSLCVGLWAIKVANQKSSSTVYTYGWQRAETLGALVNGVFLVALCLSIFLDAIQRFFEPQEVSDPKTVLVVGCAGLLSNFFGLFLFHEHSHDHGGDQSRSQINELASAEEGHGHEVSSDANSHTQEVENESGNVADVLPQNTTGNSPRSKRIAPEGPSCDKKGVPRQFTRSDEEGSTAANSSSPVSTRQSVSAGLQSHRRHNNSRSAFQNVEDIKVHPINFRNDIIAAGKLDDVGSTDSLDSGGEETTADDHELTEDTPLLRKSQSNSTGKHTDTATKGYRQKPSQPRDSLHKDHHHTQEKEPGRKGHGHGDLNMRGVFLHVMGDALGNIGVIGSALVIWLTSYSWRFYVDPAISLVITVIILGSAIPLCKAASRILLQAAPESISTGNITRDINRLPGVISCHHLHVWQLNDAKVVASLHIQVGFDIKGEGSARYMDLARAINECLHGYGIHNSTIQPEFCLDSTHQHVSKPSSDVGGSSPRDARGNATSRNRSRAGSLRSEPDACLLECSNQCDRRQCCAPSSAENETQNEPNHSH